MANTSQRDTFIAEEGDKFFVRNKLGLAQPSTVKELVVGRVAHHLLWNESSCVLEIGCSSGGNLAALGDIASVDCFGVDPSDDAVRAGNELYPNLDLRVGSADRLPFDDASMDVVWFGFCLYLVDRSLLHRAVAEADRVLKDGGMIVIHDFDPDLPCMSPYRHVPGLNSYKMNYSAFFLCDPAYTLVEKTTFNHNNNNWISDARERLALWICRRDLQHAYRKD